MNDVFRKQAYLQHIISNKENYPYKALDNTDVTVGEVYDYIKDMAFFLSQEAIELLESLANDNRNIHKPWTSNNAALRSMQFETNDNIKSEAIDMLCFCINMCLRVGVNAENIAQEYGKVYDKIVHRVETNY